MTDVLIGIALIVWAWIGFYRGLNLPENTFKPDGLFGRCNAPTLCDFWGLVRYGSMYRSTIAAGYDADGSRTERWKQ